MRKRAAGYQNKCPQDNEKNIFFHFTSSVNIVTHITNEGIEYFVRDNIKDTRQLLYESNLFYQAY